jgi:hypothetical protein
MSEVAELITNLKMNTSQFTAQIDKAEAKIGSFTSTGASKFKLMGLAMAGAFVGIAAAIAMEIDKAVESMDVLYLTSKKIGISIKALQELQLATSQSGVSSEKLTTMLQMMEKTLGQAELKNPSAVKAFTNLGLSIADLKAMSPEEQFMAISKALSSLTDNSLRVADAQAVFKRSAKDGMAWFKSDTEDAITKVKELNIGLSQVQGENIHELAVKMHELVVQSEDLGMKGLANIEPYIMGLMHGVDSIFTHIYSTLTDIGNSSIVGSVTDDFMAGLHKVQLVASDGIDHIANAYSYVAKTLQHDTEMARSDGHPSQIPSIPNMNTAQLATVAPIIMTAAKHIENLGVAAETAKKDLSQIGQDLLSSKKSGIDDELKSILGDRLDANKDANEMKKFFAGPAPTDPALANKFDVLKEQMADMKNAFADQVRATFDLIQQGGADKAQIDRMLQKADNLGDGSSADKGVVADLLKFSTEQKAAPAPITFTIKVVKNDDLKPSISVNGSASITDGSLTYQALSNAASSVGQ